MTDDRIAHVTTKCVACGTENRLALSHVHREEKVTCSSCGVALGLVGELVAASGPIDTVHVAN